MAEYTIKRFCYMGFITVEAKNKNEALEFAYESDEWTDTEEENYTYKVNKE